MITLEEVIEIGILRKPHGTRGEIQCTLLNDYLDIAEPNYLILEIDRILVPFFLEEYRYKNDETVLLTFEDIRTEEQAARLTNAKVYLHHDLLPQDTEITLTPASLVGYQVVEVQQGIIGIIADIDTSTLNPLFALDNGIIFPAHDDFVVEINTEQRILTVSLPEGMLTL